LFCAAVGEGDGQSQVSSSLGSSQEGNLTCPSSVVARFVFFCGHVALQELIHLDVAIFGELKRRRAVCEMDKASDSKAKNKALSRLSVSVAASATRSTHKVLADIACIFLNYSSFCHHLLRCVLFDVTHFLCVYRYANMRSACFFEL
jgi:hypothetical protein